MDLFLRYFFSQYRYLLIFALLISNYALGQKSVFPVVTEAVKVAIVYDNNGPKLDSIAAGLLAEDIERVTSFKPPVITDLAKARGHIIVIGAVNSPLVQKTGSKGAVFFKKINGRHERFAFYVADKPAANITKALVIAGSDARGTAYGVFTLAEKIGVSPWYWWADVPAKKQRELIIDQKNYISAPPAVKYRGIFINDEDWGLRSTGRLQFSEKKRVKQYNPFCGNIINWHLNGGPSSWDGAKRNLQPKQTIRNSIIFILVMKPKNE